MILFLGNVQEVDAKESDSFLVFVNEQIKLSQDYKPKDTMNMSQYVPTTKKTLLQKDAGQAYIKMYLDLKNAGINNLAITSGYRTYNYQKMLFEKQVRKYQSKGYSYQDAYNTGKRIVAIPGASEHQTGLAADLTINGSLNQNFGNTAAGKWLAKNSYKYGFVLSFPKDKQSITGIIYEPWHFRYVGEIHAKIMYENDWCLKEYLDYLKKAKVIEKREGDQAYVIYYGSGKIEGDVLDVSDSNVGENVITTIEAFHPLKYVYGHWAEQDIMRLFELGKLDANDYIRPNAFINRGEFISILNGVSDNLKKRDYIGFKDVSPNSKYYNSIKSAYEKGLIDGDGVNFKPDCYLTREEMAVILSRSLDLQELQYIEYEDLSKISSWAFQDIQKLSYKGIFKGYQDNTIRPKCNLTMAEAVSCINKSMQIQCVDNAENEHTLSTLNNKSDRI